MKAIRYSVITFVCGMLILVGSSCKKSSSDENPPPYQPPANPLSVKQGPNANVPEPYQVINLGLPGNFINEADPTAKENSLKAAILATTNPAPAWTMWSALPDQTLLSALVLGLDMGNIAADPSISTADACPTWNNDFAAGGIMIGACSQLQTINCQINSKANGTLDLTLGSAEDCGIKNKAFFGDLNAPNSVESQFGSMKVYGEVRDPLYPDSGLGTADCSATGVSCKDIWVTAISSDWGSGPDEVTAASAISGYIFNFDMNTTAPDLGSMPLYLVANTQIDTIDGALVMAFAQGLNDATYLSNYIIDSDGNYWKFLLDNHGATIYLYSGAAFGCLSEFDTNTANPSAGLPSENPSDYVYNSTLSDHTCGL